MDTKHSWGETIDLCAPEASTEEGQVAVLTLSSSCAVHVTRTNNSLSTDTLRIWPKAKHY